MIRIYVDTNIVSRLADQRVSHNVATAFADLSDIADTTFVTSSVTLNEVRNAKNYAKAGVLSLLVRLFEKTPWEQLEVSGAIGAHALGEVPLGGSWTDPTLEALRRIFDATDAEHIARAVKAGCDYFLTLDYQTILDRVPVHSVALAPLLNGTEIVDPVVLVAELRKRAA
jgi:predicted nucleic acid-binding protein